MTRATLGFLLCALCAGRAAAQPVPAQMTFAGRLLDGGVPVDGDHDLHFALFAAPAGGAALWEEERPGVAVDQGLLFLPLGASDPLDETVFSGARVWLEVAVDGVPLAPRVAIDSVPYALRAGSAAAADLLGVYEPEDFALAGHRHDGEYLPLGGRLDCAAGEVATGLGADGDVHCAADEDTTYAAGAGLSLAGDTFAVSFAGSGAATTAARSDHGHTGVYLPLGDALTCPAGEKATGLQSDGDLVCAADEDTTYAAGAGLSLAGDTFAVSFAGSGAATTAARSDHGHTGVYLPLGDALSCPAGEKATGLQSDGDLVCAADEDTTYAAGAGLSLAGDTFAVSFAGSGAATTAARSDHGHAGAYLPVGSALSCGGTDKVRGIDAATGSVTCATDVAPAYTASAPLAMVGTTTIGMSTTGCTAGEVWKYGGASWSCEADATGTAYTAGAGIQLVGGTISVASDVARKNTAAGNQNFDAGTLYLDYTNHRVGVGTTSPQVDLDVAGGVRADSFELQKPVAGAVSVAGAAFAVSPGVRVWTPTPDGSGRITGGTAGVAVILTSPISLPDGAVVSGLTCYLYDNDSVGNLTFNVGLYRRQRTMTSASTMATLATTTSGASTALASPSDLTVSFATVNSVDYQYYLHAYLLLTSGSSDAARFYGCAVDYTAGTLWP